MGLIVAYAVGFKNNISLGMFHSFSGVFGFCFCFMPSCLRALLLCLLPCFSVSVASRILAVFFSALCFSSFYCLCISLLEVCRLLQRQKKEQEEQEQEQQEKKEEEEGEEEEEEAEEEEEEEENRREE